MKCKNLSCDKQNYLYPGLCTYYEEEDKCRDSSKQTKSPDVLPSALNSLLCDMKKVKKLANNALYFDDSSDYGTALWQILTVVSPETFKDDDEPCLKYI